MKKHRISGISLIELLVAVLLIGVVLIFAVPMYRNYMADSMTVDALSALKAIELEIQAPARKTSGLHACDNGLVNSDNLRSNYLNLNIHPVPNDLTDPSGGKGYAAALKVLATSELHGSNGIAVAKLFYEEVRNGRSAQFVDGIMTDSVVTFDVMVSFPGEPYCDLSLTLASGGADAKKAGGGGGAAANRPPIAGNRITLGTLKEDTQFSINTQQLIASSYDPDGDALSIVSMSTGAGQIIGGSGTGFVFKPAPDFSGNGVTLNFEVSDGLASASGTALVDVLPVTDPPVIQLTLSASQQILQTGTNGRAVIPQINTGGNMREMSLEFSVVGRAAGDAAGSSGPVIFNYGDSSNNNLISAWRPNNLNIAFLDKGYDTGIDLTDGSNHRVTITWSSTTGTLKIFDNGVLKKTHNDVGRGAEISGDGHVVIGQKMNNPASGDGWNANEHYEGQIFGASFATQARDDASIASEPLYTMARSEGLVMDVRAQGASLVDGQGNGNLQMQGDFSVTSAQVDTGLALVPPGSKLTIKVDVQPGDKDSTVNSITLSGLPSSAQISDGAGNSGSGSVDITGWSLGSLTAQLPASLKSNLDIKVKATVTGIGGNAQAEVSRPLILSP